MYNDFEVYGVKGFKSVPFRKSFKTRKAMVAWIEKNGEAITIQGIAYPTEKEG